MMTKKEQATGTGSVRPSADAAPSALTAVSALMEERRRFESWLAALDARRDTTPPRVFTRVHADYTTRLEAVVSQLTAHGEGLQAELARLTDALEAAHDEQQQARDERAEAELRAHVGELSASEWETTARAADERIDRLASRHADLESELLRTRDLLAEARRPTPHHAAAAIPASRDQAAIDATVSASVDAAAATATPAAVQAVSDSSEAALHVPSSGASPDVSAPSPDSVPAELPPSVIAAEATLMDGPPAPERPRAPSTPGFDELAFLNSVVDTPPKKQPDVPAPAPAPAPRRDSVVARSTDGEIENRDASADTSILGRSTKKGTPMAANISGNNPIILKDKPAESAKTLKCADCGAMNYPTEWYCERCGAELASL